MDPLTGMLLIANSPLFDPNFRRTVVFIGHHDEEGAVGVVLNRTLEVTVREAVPPLGGLVTEDEPLHVGGPVQPDSVVVVADFVDPSRAEILAMGSIGFLPPEADEDIVDGDPPGAGVRRLLGLGRRAAGGRTRRGLLAASSRRSPTTCSIRSPAACGLMCSAARAGTSTCCA